MEVHEEYIIPSHQVKFQTPELALYAGVISQALGDLNIKMTRKDAQAIYNDAYAWLTDLRSNHPTSLRKCCEVLGLDAESISNKVRAGDRIDRFHWKVNGMLHKVAGKPLTRERNWMRAWA